MPKRVGQRSGQCMSGSHYNLRSNAYKRLRVDYSEDSWKTSSSSSTADDSLDDDSMTGQTNCGSNMSTPVTPKLTKMPNKSYNLRRRAIRSAQSVGRQRPPPVSRVTINDLPDDCLLDIFDKLDTIQDKCALQRVSKRFNLLINRLLRAQKSFTVGSTFGESTDQLLTQKICRTIIKKCPNLETFKMPGFYTKASIAAVNERIGDKEMVSLGKKCKELKELDICGCGNVTERGITHIADVCPKLEKLSISFCMNVTGASLKKLTKNFKTLSINTNEMSPSLVECLNSLSKGEGKHITELNVCAYNELPKQENILQLICSQFQLLKTLRYSIISKDLVKYGLFGSLVNLTELVFDCSSVNLSDHEMLKIMEGCKQLKSIFIRYEHSKDHNNSITDYSLRKFPLFWPNLTKIHLQSKGIPIHGVTDVTVDAFSQLIHLEFLALRSFDNIDDSVISVIKSCPKLSTLYLHECHKVTNKSVDALIAAAKSRPNKRIKYDITSNSLKKRKKKLPNNLIHCSKKQ